MLQIVFALIAALPTGSAFVTTGGSCSGSLTANSCLNANVSCKNLWDPVANVPFSIDDLTATLKVTNPSGAVVGTLISGIGGGGTGSAEANTYGVSGFLQPALDAGWRVVQILWGSGSGNGQWGGSTSANSYGGDNVPDGPLYLACRYATLTEYICDDSTLHTAGTPCVAYGQSGTSGGIAYALVRYGAERWLSGAVLSGGPPFGALERGCSGTTYPSWMASTCPTLRTGVSGTGCVHTDSDTSGQFVDKMWNDGRTSCAKQQGGIGLGYQSLFGGDAQRRFSNTTLRFVYGDQDTSEAEPLGRWVAQQLVDATGSTPVNIITTGASAPHAVLDATDGAVAVKTMLLGGTYLSVTYSALSTALPTITNDWTPELIRGAEFWLSTHSLPHLWVEDYGTQALTNPASDGDAVRVVDDPVNGHFIGGATTSGTTLSSSGNTSYIRFTRADSDWMSVKDSATMFDRIHKTGVGAILFRMGFAANDGVLQSVLDTANGTTSNSGIYINRSTGNKLVVQMMRSSAGTYVFNCTSTANFNVATGIVSGYIIFGGQTGAKLKIGANAEESCSYSAAPSTASAAQVMWLGRASGSGNAADLMLADLVVSWKTPLPSEITKWMAWAPTRTSSNLLRWKGPDQGFYNFTQRFYRYDVTDGLYTDSACTTHVLASGDAIGCVRTVTSPDGHLGRSGTQSTAANQPTWRGAATGGEWDGSNDELTMTQTGDPGASTTIVIGSNDDTTNGSHYLSAGGRFLFTGTVYSGNSPAQSPAHANGVPYLTVHPGTGGTCLSDLLHTSAGQLNAGMSRRQGSAWTQSVLQYSGGAVSRPNECTATNANSIHFTHMGAPAIANWDTDGYVKAVWVNNVRLTDTQTDPVIAYMCQRFGGC